MGISLFDSVCYACNPEIYFSVPFRIFFFANSRFITQKMELWQSKVISLFAMGILTIIAAYLPIFLLQRFKNSLTNKNSRKKLDQGLSLLNCFVGGVFLATTLVHMLPEAREATEAYMEQLELDIEFPVTEFTCCIGVFIVMILEHMAWFFVDLVKKKKTTRKPSFRMKAALQTLNWIKAGDPDTTARRPLLLLGRISATTKGTIQSGQGPSLELRP